MTTQEITAATEEVKKACGSEINKAMNILWSRYLKSPCSFKNKDFDKAAFAAYFDGASVVLHEVEKKYGMRFVINTISAQAAGALRENIQTAKANK